MSRPITINAEQVVVDLGWEPTETNVKQMRVMLRAFAIFIERNASYRDLWREGGVQDSINHCRSKLRRMEILKLSNDTTMRTLFEDSALDLINFTAFALRNLEDPITTTEVSK